MGPPPTPLPSVWDRVEVGPSRFLGRWGPQRLTSVTSLAVVITTMITTSVFAPRYVMWDKSFSNSVPGFVETMKLKYPAVYASLAAVPTLVGSAARTQFVDAFENLNAVFGGPGGAKEVFLVAVAVWVLLSAKSNKAS